MTVVHNSLAFNQDPIHFLNLERFIDFSKSGYSSLHICSPKHYDSLPDRPSILLDLELPNRLLHEDTREIGLLNERRFDKILTIDPLFCSLRNSILGFDLYHPVFFPYPNEFITHEFGNKSYDLIYMGNTIPDVFFHLELASKAIPKPINYVDKLKVIADSKMSLVHCCYFLNDYTLNQAVRYPEFFYLKTNHLAQYKSRVFEAAFNQSLMLCLEDDFNIINSLFEVNKHFLFVNKDNINSVVNYYLRNEEERLALVKSAYEFAVCNYTSQHFVHKYLTNISHE